MNVAQALTATAGSFISVEAVVKKIGVPKVDKKIYKGVLQEQTSQWVLLEDSVGKSTIFVTLYGRVIVDGDVGKVVNIVGAKVATYPDKKNPTQMITSLQLGMGELTSLSFEKKENVTSPVGQPVHLQGVLPQVSVVQQQQSALEQLVPTAQAGIKEPAASVVLPEEDVIDNNEEFQQLVDETLENTLDNIDKALLERIITWAGLYETKLKPMGFSKEDVRAIAISSFIEHNRQGA